MDATKSGAIFLLKNIAIVRSPHAIPISNGGDKNNSGAKTSPQITNGDLRNADEAAEIRRRFTEIYRSTPKPSAILNSSQGSNFWEHGYNNTPAATNFTPHYGASPSIAPSQYHRANNPYYHSAPQLHHQLYGNYGVRNEFTPANMHPLVASSQPGGHDVPNSNSVAESVNTSQLHVPEIANRVLEIANPVVEIANTVVEIADSVPEIANSASVEDEVSGPLDNAGSEQDDNDMACEDTPDVEQFSHDDRSEISISTSLHSGTSSIVGIPSHGSGRSRGKRKSWVDTLVNFTQKPIAAPSSSGSHPPVQSQQKVTGLSFISNLPRTKVHSPSRAKSAKSSSQSKKSSRLENLQRFGSLTMIPTAMLASPLTTFSSYDSSSSSDGERVKKKPNRRVQRSLPASVLLAAGKTSSSTSEDESGVLRRNHKAKTSAGPEIPEMISEHLEIAVVPDFSAAGPLPVIGPNKRLSANKRDRVQPAEAPIRAKEDIEEAANTASHREIYPVGRNTPSSAPSSRHDWSTDEVLALHASQLLIEPTAADFWQLVGAEMTQKGYRHSAEECRDKWFQSSDKTSKIKGQVRPAKKKSLSVATNKSNAPSSSSTIAVTAEDPGLDSTDKSVPEVTEQKGKRKRVLRADLQRLAEESSKATRADDIFEYQKEQNARVFVTVGGANKGQLRSASTSSTQPVGVIKGSDPLPIPGPKRKGSQALEGLSELQSPKGKASEDADDDESLPVLVGKKSNSATYVHNLSKKISATRSGAVVKDTKTTVKSSKSGTSKSTQSGQGKASEGGVTAALSLKTGKVVIADRVPRKSNSQDVEEDINDSDEYNQNMSEDEDGDF